MMLLITSLTTGDDIPNKPTLNVLKLQSSKILSNFQGQSHDRSNYFKDWNGQSQDQSNYFKDWNGQSNTFKDWNTTIYPQSYIIQYDFIEDHQYEIIQIDENSFRVLGSPIEWEYNNRLRDKNVSK